MYFKIKKFLKEKYKTTRFKLSGANHPLFIAYYKYLFFPRKNTLNHFLHHYSLSKKSLTVIQIGANDGMTHDPIHKFIKRDSWNGVLLEPQAYVYHNYLKKVYKNNNGIETLCAAIGEEDGVKKLYKIAFTDMRWATGLASFYLQNVKNAFDSGFVKFNCDKYGIQLPSQPEKQIVAEEIAMISPSTLLASYNIKQIDLLAIDTEGFDFEVIKLFNIEKTQPKVIIYENVHLTTQNKDACLNLLLNNDYAITEFGFNSVAMKKPLGKFKDYFLNDRH